MLKMNFYFTYKLGISKNEIFSNKKLKKRIIFLYTFYYILVYFFFNHKTIFIISKKIKFSKFITILNSDHKQLFY